MSSLTSSHRPVAQAPQPVAPRRAKPASLFARLFLVPKMSGWEQFLVWFAVLVACVLAFHLVAIFSGGAW